MTLKEFYKALKNGSCFTRGNSYICIGTCDRWGSPSYGKDYIYWQHYGASAETVSYESFRFLVHTIFGLKSAKQFAEYFTEE